jgi:hypothetical protein
MKVQVIIMNVLIPIYGTVTKDYVSFSIMPAPAPASASTSTSKVKYQLITENGNTIAVLTRKSSPLGIKLEGGEFTMILMNDFNQSYSRHGVIWIAMLYFGGETVGNYYIFDSLDPLGLGPKTGSEGAKGPTGSSGSGSRVQTSWV